MSLDKKAWKNILRTSWPLGITLLISVLLLLVGLDVVNFY